MQGAPIGADERRKEAKAERQDRDKIRGGAQYRGAEPDAIAPEAFAVRRHHFDPGRHLADGLPAGGGERHEVRGGQQGEKDRQRSEGQDEDLEEREPAELRRQVQDRAVDGAEDGGIDRGGRQPWARQCRLQRLLAVGTSRRARAALLLDGRVNLKIEPRLVAPDSRARRPRRRTPDRQRRTWHRRRRHERTAVVGRAVLEERQIGAGRRPAHRGLAGGRRRADGRRRR